MCRRNTRVFTMGNKTDRAPVWNERFTFDTYDPQLDQLRIEVKDKNFTARCANKRCGYMFSLVMGD